MYTYYHNSGKSVWLSKYGNEINSTSLDYWCYVNDIIELIENMFNEELSITIQALGL